MGAWGVGSFENDQALDWLYELKETNDLSLIEECLNINNLKDGLDECICTDLIAACEIVAAMLGFPADNLPKEAETWIKNNKDLDIAHLIEMCKRGLDAILSDGSGLKELWQESESYKAWKQDILNLKRRVSGKLSIF